MLLVVTAVTAGFDLPKAPALDLPGVAYLCFSDDLLLAAPAPWVVLPVGGGATWTAQERSRLPKLQPHAYLAGTNYSACLWVDAYFRVVGDVRQMVRQLGDGDVGLRPHVLPCVYEIGQANVAGRIRTASQVAAELDLRRAEGWPRRAGAYAGCVVLHRPGPGARAFFDAWYSLWREGCGRDELSLPVAAARSGAQVAALPAPPQRRGQIVERSDGLLRHEPRTPIAGPAAGA